MGNVSGCFHANFEKFVCNTKRQYSSLKDFTKFILINYLVWEDTSEKSVKNGSNLPNAK